MGGKITHGLTGTKTHKLWKGIKQRCYNVNNRLYKYYGGRGITMCDEWCSDFQTFHDHVTKLIYYGEPGRSLDRYPDNDGNYEPENVRWATKHEQATNRRIPKGNKSGYVGVFFNKKTNKWFCKIKINGDIVYLGTRDTPAEAAMDRNNYIIGNNLTEYGIQPIKK